MDTILSFVFPFFPLKEYWKIFHFWAFLDQFRELSTLQVGKLSGHCGYKVWIWAFPWSAAPSELRPLALVVSPGQLLLFLQILRIAVLCQCLHISPFIVKLFFIEFITSWLPSEMKYANSQMYVFVLFASIPPGETTFDRLFAFATNRKYSRSITNLTL